MSLSKQHIKTVLLEKIQMDIKAIKDLNTF